MKRFKDLLPCIGSQPGYCAPAQLFALLLLVLPGCTRETPGYCLVDEDCGRDQYCAIPASQCTTALVLRALLSGDQVVPPTASQATGDFQMIVNDTQTSGHYTLNLTFNPPVTPSAVLGAEIRLGSIGQPDQASAALATIGLPSLPITADLPLNSDFVTALRTGQYYIRVTTSTFPVAGEIRGQIFSLNPADDRTTPVHLTGILSGEQEAPAISSPGLGTTAVDFVENAGQITVKYNLSGLTGPITGMHVHRGSFNVNGDQIYVLPAGPMDFQDNILVGQDRILPNQTHLFGLAFKSGLTYLNVHSAMFAAGELRAQLLPTAALPFNIALKVPAGGTATGSSGEAEFYLSADQSKLAYRIVHTVANPTGVMIVRPAVGMVKAMPITCPALTMSAAVSGAQGYCDVDSKTLIAGTGTVLTLGDLTLNAVSVVITSGAAPTGELAGLIMLPKGM